MAACILQGSVMQEEAPVVPQTCVYLRVCPIGERQPLALLGGIQRNMHPSLDAKPELTELKCDFKQAATDFQSCLTLPGLLFFQFSFQIASCWHLW